MLKAMPAMGAVEAVEAVEAAEAVEEVEEVEAVETVAGIRRVQRAPTPRVTCWVLTTTRRRQGAACSWHRRRFHRAWRGSSALK